MRRNKGMQVFKKFISAPIFVQDEEKTHIAAMINIILSSVLGLSAVFALVYTIFFHRFLGIGIFVVLFLLRMGALHLMRKGFVSLTLILLLGLLWTGVTALTAASGGVESIHFISFINIILIAGLLLKGRMALTFALASSLCGLLMLYLGVRGLLPRYFSPTPFGAWMIVSANFVMSMLMLYLAGRRVRYAVAQAKYHEREAAERAAKMQQLAREAQEANTFRSRLMARVSHELRTPLNAMQGFSEMLYYAMYGQLTPDQHEAVKKILIHSRQLEKVISEMLEQSNIEAGKLRMNVVTFSPSELLEKVIETYNPLATTKGLIFRTEIASDLPESLSGDPEKVGEILSSLISNAIKFTGDGGSVSVHLTRAQNNSWAIHVADTGIGIPPESQVHLFEPFRQADESATRPYGGMGLGLALVKELTTLMSGSVTFTSEAGIGSIFTVFLPLELPQQGEQPQGH
ncbi:MAG: HAMP domain-containing histidine kinase [Anaerolineae bacterium]|nr:HAMP domain-containing histidine kinase [Anaerolineae bacterium]